MAFNPYFWHSGSNLNGFTHKNTKKEGNKDISIGPIIFKRIENIEKNFEKFKIATNEKFILISKKIIEIENSIIDFLTKTEADELYQPLTKIPLDLSSYTVNGPFDLIALSDGVYDILESGYICANPMGSNPNTRKRQVAKGSTLVNFDGYTTFVGTDGYIYTVDNEGTVITAWGNGVLIDLYTLRQHLSQYLSIDDAVLTYQQILTAGSGISIENNVISATGGGGSSDNWCVIANTTLAEAIGSSSASAKMIEFSTDINGNSLANKNIRHLNMFFYFPTDSGALYNQFNIRFNGTGSPNDFYGTIEPVANKYAAATYDVMNSQQILPSETASVATNAKVTYQLSGYTLATNRGNPLAGYDKFTKITFYTNYPSGTILPAGTKIMITGW